MRTETIKNIIEQIKIEKNLEYSSFTSDEKILKLLNKSWRKLYNILVGVSESYKYREAVLTCESGIVTLPDDFFKLLTVTDSNEVNYRTYQEVSVLEFTMNSFSPTPFRDNFMLVENTLKFVSTTFPDSVKVRYIPQAETLVEEVYDVSTGVLGGLTFTSIDTGKDADSITITYVSGGIAGSESVSVSDFAIEVSIESGVSTSTQIKSAIEADSNASALISCELGTSQAETTGSVSLSGGVTDGTISLIANEDDYLVADVCKALSKRSEEGFDEWESDMKDALEMTLRFLTPRNVGNNKRVIDTRDPQLNRPQVRRMY